MEGEKIGRRTGVAEGAVFHSQPFGEVPLEAAGPWPGSEPEIEGRVHEVHHLFVVEETAAVVDAGLARNENVLFGGMHLAVVFPGEFQDPGFQLFFLAHGSMEVNSSICSAHMA